jgi:ankyrin repeat protein
VIWTNSNFPPALNCHEDAVRFLLDAGGTATCNQPDACGSTAALDASACGSVSILRLLSQSTDLKTHKDTRGLGCLHKAASAGHIEAVQFLLGQLAFDANEETDDGFTALMFAAMEMQVPVVQLLASMGAQTQTTKRNGKSICLDVNFYRREKIKMDVFINCNLFFKYAEFSHLSIFEISEMSY